MRAKNTQESYKTTTLNER